MTTVEVPHALWRPWAGATWSGRSHDRPSPGRPFSADIGRTPLVDVTLHQDNGAHRVRLKLESCNPGGSIKDRTAYALIRSLERAGRLKPGAAIVESTSGNLGLALAALAQGRGYRFIAVVDPKTSVRTLAALESTGARIEPVSERDYTGGFLLSRLARVSQLLAADPTLVWTDQYSNPANPRIHFEQTGPEILRQNGGPPAAVFVAVSTGGTLAGVGRYFKTVAPSTMVIGVDLRGSLVFDRVPAPRLLTGIGSGQRSRHLRPEHYDGHCLISDAEAIIECHAVMQHAGVSLGGSSGAVLAACARYLKKTCPQSPVVCLCPDDGTKYVDTIYDDTWLDRHGIDVTSARIPGRLGHRYTLEAGQ
jgi:N-(2-amino-2-carboxyethyl)-L-glutamate synthase